MEKVTKEIIDAAAGYEKSDLVLKNVQYLNVFTNEFLQGNIAVKDGIFVGCGEYEGIEEIDMTGKTIVPSFVDSHVHLESSMISPLEYACAVAPHGTCAVVADPHEIANVCGTRGIDYIIEATENLPIDVHVMIPSCVPATSFDESFEAIEAENMEKYFSNPRVSGLGEVMNFVGVVNSDEKLLKKINAAVASGKNLDGHAPGVGGKGLNAYRAAQITTDHECSEFDEALEKMRCGQWILIREGTAGKNLTNLSPLICEQYYERCLFATDDKHPGELTNEGHIDEIIRKAINLGADPVLIYKIASYNAALCYNLHNLGAIASGYTANFVVLTDIEDVEIDSVYFKGEKLPTENAMKKIYGSYVKEIPDYIKHTMNISEVSSAAFALKKEEEKIIGLVPHEILTTDCGYAKNIDAEKDILKIAVCERHHNTGHVGVAFIKGYGLKHGAVATSIAHDSHNIIVVGENEADMALAANRIRSMEGGISICSNGGVIDEIPLPIAGLMCELSAKDASLKLDELKEKAYALGVSRDIDPFMTLSFASLPVIPKLKLTTFGVFDVDQFKLI